MGPLPGGDEGFGVGHAEEDATGVAVEGADFLVVEGVGVVDGYHVFGEDGGVVDRGEAEAAADQLLLLLILGLLGGGSGFQGLKTKLFLSDFDGDGFREGAVDDGDDIVVVFG